MKATTSFCTNPDPAQVAASLRDALSAPDVRLLVYFASAAYDSVALAREMGAAFPGVPSFGCTTAGEIVSGHMLERSVVAMALGHELVRRVAIAPAEHVAADPRGASRAAMQSLERQLGASLTDLACETYCGLILSDGLSGVEEIVMDELGNASNLTFIGGSAGDDLQFRRTHVFANGRAYSDVAALAVVEMAVPFRVVKTQSFRVLPKVLVATKVDEQKREVIEFDHKPAATAYADALGVPVAELAGEFMKHPLGLLAENEPFVRSPQAVKGTTVGFYCRILEGMTMHLLQSTDIVADTGTAVTDLGQPSAILNFHCILRTLELKNKGQCPAYGRIFDKVPTVGFSTYGEAYIGHINQTSTILVIGG